MTKLSCTTVRIMAAVLFVVLAASAYFYTSDADANAIQNGLSFNGLSFNGLSFNGRSLTGVSAAGMRPAPGATMLILSSGERIVLN